VEGEQAGRSLGLHIYIYIYIYKINIYSINLLYIIDTFGVG
jgi:hypothetical protein